jgi:hypothetical protein
MKVLHLGEFCARLMIPSMASSMEVVEAPMSSRSL